MRIYINNFSNEVTATAGVNNRIRKLVFRRGDTVPIQVQFYEDDRIVELPPNATGRLAMKERGKYSDNPIVFSDTWTKTGSDSDTVYTFQPSLSGQTLANLLGSQKSVELMFEIEWQIGATIQSTAPFGSEEIIAEIWNDINKNGAVIPDPGPDPYPPTDQLVYYHADISAWEGGTGLESLATVGIPLERMIAFTVGGQPFLARLIESEEETDLEGNPIYVRPTDYDAVNNKRAWVSWIPEAVEPPEPGDALPAGAKGNMLYHDGTNWVVLTGGAGGKILSFDDGIPKWVTNSGGGEGGTGLPAASKGAILYHDGEDWVTLSFAEDGKILGADDGVPAWVTAPGPGEGGGSNGVQITYEREFFEPGLDELIGITQYYVVTPAVDGKIIWMDAGTGGGPRDVQIQLRAYAAPSIAQNSASMNVNWPPSGRAMNQVAIAGHAVLVMVVDNGEGEIEGAGSGEPEWADAHVNLRVTLVFQPD